MHNIYLFTKKSLLGMPSKSEGSIQPSVTSQPPRLTALMAEEGVDLAAEEIEVRCEHRRRNKRHAYP